VFLIWKISFPTPTFPFHPQKSNFTPNFTPQKSDKYEPNFLKLRFLVHAQIPSVDLPSLKFLHLESVTFTHNEYLIKILSACPVLEELETKDLTVKEIYRVHPECPDTYVTGLSKLSRANISGDHILYDCLHNANHLQLHVVRATMLIYSNNIGLISFYPAKYASLRYPCNFFC
jgi:hypothetical protein